MLQYIQPMVACWRHLAVKGFFFWGGGGGGGGDGTIVQTITASRDRRVAINFACSCQ